MCTYWRLQPQFLSQVFTNHNHLGATSCFLGGNSPARNYERPFRPNDKPVAIFDRPRRANDSKDDRRMEKRTEKRDIKKQFKKPYKKPFEKGAKGPNAPQTGKD